MWETQVQQVLAWGSSGTLNAPELVNLSYAEEDLRAIDLGRVFNPK
jgi:hypothetical protein